MTTNEATKRIDNRIAELKQSIEEEVKMAGAALRQSEQDRLKNAGSIFAKYNVLCEHQKRLDDAVSSIRLAMNKILALSETKRVLNGEIEKEDGK